MPTNHDVADITALKAIPASSTRVNGYIKLVRSPAVGEAPSWYCYRTSFTGAALGNIVVAPDDTPTNAMWVKVSNLIHYAAALPAATPPIRGVVWIASLSTPTRNVSYISIGTTSAADWIPYGNEVITGTAVPNFTPDYVGQLFSDSTNNKLYIAENTTNSSGWVDRTGT